MSTPKTQLDITPPIAPSGNPAAQVSDRKTQAEVERKTQAEVERKTQAEGDRKTQVELLSDVERLQILEQALNKYVDKQWVNQHGYIHPFDKSELILEQRGFENFFNAPIKLEKPGYTMDELLSICKALEVNKHIKVIVFRHADLIKLFDNNEAKENMERLALAFKKTGITAIGITDICLHKDCVPHFFYNYNFRFRVERAERVDPEVEQAERNNPELAKAYLEQLLSAEVFIGNKYPKKVSFHFNQLLCKELLKEGRMLAFLKWMVSSKITFFGCFQESKFYYKNRNVPHYDARENPFSKQNFYETEKAFISSLFQHLSMSPCLKEFRFEGWNLEKDDYMWGCCDVIKRVHQNRKGLDHRLSITMSAGLAVRNQEYAQQVAAGENFNKSPIDDVPTKFLFLLFQNGTLANTLLPTVFEMMGIDDKTFKPDNLGFNDNCHAIPVEEEVCSDVPTIRLPWSVVQNYEEREKPKKRTVYKIRI